jgi:hypothetical protein
VNENIGLDVDCTHGGWDLSFLSDLLLTRGLSVDWASINAGFERRNEDVDKHDRCISVLLGTYIHHKLSELPIFQPELLNLWLAERRQARERRQSSWLIDWFADPHTSSPKSYSSNRQRTRAIHGYL